MRLAPQGDLSHDILISPRSTVTGDAVEHIMNQRLGDRLTKTFAAREQAERDTGSSRDKAEAA